MKGFYTKRILLNKLNVVLRLPWPHLNQDAIVRERKWLLETGYKISSQDCFDYIYKKIFLICSKFYHTKMFNLIKRNISRHVIRYLNRDESFKFLRKNLILEPQSRGVFCQRAKCDKELSHFCYTNYHLLQ